VNMDKLWWWWCPSSWAFRGSFSACLDTGSGNGHFHGFVYHWKSKDAPFRIAVKPQAICMLWWSAILLPDLLGLLMCVDIIKLNSFLCTNNLKFKWSNQEVFPEATRERVESP